MTNKNNEALSDREIVISREFNAPRELVWEAMTNHKHVVNWWGPRGFSTTIETMDFRVGGVWKHVMRGPDGTNYPNESIFKEIVKPERIVYSHGGKREGGPGVSFVATWTFDALASDKTRVTIHHVFPSAAARDFVVKEFGAIEGGKQTLERLGEHLAAAAAKSLVITRTFAAPRELVFKAWTNPSLLIGWFGPKHHPAFHMEADARPGGVWRGALRGVENGEELWLGGVFREVVEFERIVFTFAWEEEGERGLETLVTITLTEQAGKTRMDFRQSPFQSDEQQSGHHEGWSSCFDRLAEQLASR